jgi:hypothetical protein
MTLEDPMGTSFDEIIRGAYENLEECKQAIKRSMDGQLAMLRSLAGPDFQAMYEKPAIARNYLSHPNPKLRLAGLLVLVGERDTSDEFARRCEDMVINDPDPQVQVVALSALARLHATKCHTKIGELAARIVSDDSRNDDTRLYAYATLYRLSGRPPEEGPLWRQARGGFRFPGDVDWALVNSFLPR